MDLAPVQGASAAARDPSAACGYAQAQSWAARPSGAGVGRHLPAGAALLLGLATDLREINPDVCAGDVCRAVVLPGCECWRGNRGGQSLASAAISSVPLGPREEASPLPPLAHLALWGW